LPDLENLVSSGQLKRATPSAVELGGLVRAGEARLRDARVAGISPEGQFDLAYNAAHALALALLWHQGYRAENRYIVFQVLPQTGGLPLSTARVLIKAHEVRNKLEYEGEGEVGDRLLEELFRATEAVAQTVRGRVR
jgi:hypothetical protein